MLQKPPTMVHENGSDRNGFLDAQTKRLIISQLLMIVGTVMKTIGEQMAQNSLSEAPQFQVNSDEQSTKQESRGKHDLVPQNNRMGIADQRQRVNPAPKSED